MAYLDNTGLSYFWGKIKAYVTSAISGKEDVSNKVTSLSSSSTDTEYPSAKVVYDALQKIDTLYVPSRIRAIDKINPYTVIGYVRVPGGTYGGYTTIAAGVQIDLSSPILYWNSPTALTTTDTGAYAIYPDVDLDHTWMTPSNYTGYKTVFLVGVLEDGLFTVARTVFTTDVPTTDDGKMYVPIGIALISVSHVYFHPSSKVYAFKNGAFREITAYSLDANVDLSGVEEVANKVTSISSSSTDIQYPSAKATHDYVDNIIESVLANHFFTSSEAQSLPVALAKDDLVVVHDGSNYTLGKVIEDLAVGDSLIIGKYHYFDDESTYTWGYNYGGSFLGLGVGNSYMDVPDGTVVTIAFDARIKIDSTSYYFGVYSQDSNGSPKWFRTLDGGWPNRVESQISALDPQPQVEDEINIPMHVTGKIIDNPNPSQTINTLEFYCYNMSYDFDVSNLIMWEGTYEQRPNALLITIDEGLRELLELSEQKANKVTSISSSSTHANYPSAKAVVDFFNSYLGQPKSLTLLASGWTAESSVRYTQTVTVSGMTADTIPTATIDYPTNVGLTDKKAIDKAASYLTEMTTGAGTVEFVACAEPQVDIPLQLTVSLPSGGASMDALQPTEMQTLATYEYGTLLGCCWPELHFAYVTWAGNATAAPSGNVNVPITNEYVPIGSALVPMKDGHYIEVRSKDNTVRLAFSGNAWTAGAVMYRTV